MLGNQRGTIAYGKVDRQHAGWTRGFAAPRQYCGQLGKQDNCQVAVSLSVAFLLGRNDLHCIAQREVIIDRTHFEVTLMEPDYC